jgi:hypothetical protein
MGFGSFDLANMGLLGFTEISSSYQDKVAIQRLSPCPPGLTSLSAVGSKRTGCAPFCQAELLCIHEYF